MCVEQHQGLVFIVSLVSWMKECGVLSQYTQNPTLDSNKLQEIFTCLKDLCEKRCVVEIRILQKPCVVCHNLVYQQKPSRLHCEHFLHSKCLPPNLSRRKIKTLVCPICDLSEFNRHSSISKDESVKVEQRSSKVEKEVRPSEQDLLQQYAEIWFAEDLDEIANS